MDRHPSTGITFTEPYAGSAPAVSCDQNWRMLTEQANRAYEQGDMASYANALAEAERLFDAVHDASSGAPVPVIYNISCHNLAELMARSGEMTAAEAFYQRAFDRLISAAQSPATAFPMRMACVQHLKQALAALVQHLRVTAASESQIADVASRAHATARNVFCIAQHLEQSQPDNPHPPFALS